MPGQATLFANQEMVMQGTYTRGLPELTGSATFAGQGQCGQFFVGTGKTGTLDATPGQTSNVTLLSDAAVPSGMRCYITDVHISVLGAVNWSATSPTTGSVPSLSLRDSAGVPAVVIPFNALKGLARYGLPVFDVPIPLLLGPATVNGPVGTPVSTFTYVQSTGVITAGATSFISTIGIGGTARVVDGTGVGQAAFVTAVTATTITVSPAFTGLDATSVIGVDYQALSAYTNTTTVGLFNGGATPYVANSFDNGYNIIGVTGAGVGQVRSISANTNAGVLTLGAALDTAMNATTTLLQITNEPNANGLIDCCVGQTLATLTPNKGLQLVVDLKAGTSPVGSAVRVLVKGFYAL